MTGVRGPKTEGEKVGKGNAEVGNCEQAAIGALSNAKTLNTFPLFNKLTNNYSIFLNADRNRKKNNCFDPGGYAGNRAALSGDF
jgi:hypothetical protein